MATSGSTTFSLTAREVALDALQDNAIIGIGAALTADEQDAVIRRMNLMFKSWQMQGLLWKQETISATITADTATIALPAYVRGVNGVRYVQSATNERQMARFGRDEYNDLPNKAASGVSTIYYVQRAEDGLVLYVWPVPTANATIKVDIDRKLDTVTSASETLDIPEELMETVTTNLAVRCCGIFGKQPDPEIYQRAAMLERTMLDNYRPASYIIEAA